MKYRRAAARTTTVMQQVYSMKNFLVSLVLVAFFGVAGAQDVVYHHDLEVSIDPETSRLEVTDTIAVPGSRSSSEMEFTLHEDLVPEILNAGARIEDRKSTRLNSSHVAISYAVSCLK